MQTIEKPETAHAPPGDAKKLESRNRILTWLVGLLTVAVVGLGAWLAFDTSGNGADVPSEVLATVDGYVDALNDGTIDEMLAFTTARYEFENQGYTFSADEMRANFTLAQTQQLRVDMTDRMATGDGPYYVSTSDAAQRGGVIFEGISTFTIVEENGEWKIARHYYVGPL